MSRIYHLARSLYFYRLNPQSLSHQQTDLQRQASVWAVNQLGKAQQQLGETAAAIATYQHLIALNSTVPQAHCNLGAIWQMQDNPEAAIAAYQQAIDLKPDFAIARLNLAKLLVSLGQSIAAAEHYQAVVQANPQQ